MTEIERTELFYDLSRHLVRLERYRRRFLDEKLEDYGITGSMYRYILKLYRNPGISQDQMADYMCVDKSHVARVVRKLEDMGLIYRQEDQQDRRANKLFLTERGQQVRQPILDQMYAWSEIITKSVSLEDIALVNAILEKILKDI